MLGEALCDLAQRVLGADAHFAAQQGLDVESRGTSGQVWVSSSGNTTPVSGERMTPPGERPVGG
jgi:hypothetical protein